MIKKIATIVLAAFLVASTMVVTALAATGSDNEPEPAATDNSTIEPYASATVNMYGENYNITDTYRGMYYAFVGTSTNAICVVRNESGASKYIEESVVCINTITGAEVYEHFDTHNNAGNGYTLSSAGNREPLNTAYRYKYAVEMKPDAENSYTIASESLTVTQNK